MGGVSPPHSCSVQLAPTVRIGHGSPPFLAELAGTRGRKLVALPSRRGLPSRVTVGRGSGGDSHRRRDAGLSFSLYSPAAGLPLPGTPPRETRGHPPLSKASAA